MSSAVVSTSAALGRPFLFDDDPDAVGAPVLAAVARSGKVAVVPEDLKKPAGKQSAVAQFVQSTINNQKSTINNPPDPGVAPRNPPCRGDGLQWHRRARQPDRRPASRMPYRNLWPRFFRPDQRNARGIGSRDPTRRILRPARCQRLPRS